MNIGRNISGEIMDALLANGLQPICRHLKNFSEIRPRPHAGQPDAVTFIVIDHFATTPEEAVTQAELILPRLNFIRNNIPDNADSETTDAENKIGIKPNSGKAMVIPADLWRRHREMTLGRMLAHCGIFTRIFARNCEVRRIRKPEADAFMNAAHSYGTAVCRNRYGLFTLRDSVLRPYKNIENTQNNTDRNINIPTISSIPAGTLVAVAEFSNMRLIHEEKRNVRSYEWIRYASLPSLRVDGGMGKVLRKFIDDIRPGDVVSYADLEWSDGEVYRTLGFRQVGARPPVLFSIDPETMSRTPITGSRKVSSVLTHALYYQNFGSLRYRLIL